MDFLGTQSSWHILNYLLPTSSVLILREEGHCSWRLTIHIRLTHLILLFWIFPGTKSALYFDGSLVSGSGTSNTLDSTGWQFLFESSHFGILVDIWKVWVLLRVSLLMKSVLHRTNWIMDRWTLEVCVLDNYHAIFILKTAIPRNLLCTNIVLSTLQRILILLSHFII
jgi:hypothetical protein